jgi:LPXTG-site transpeptidase (sortase) family protein
LDTLGKGVGWLATTGEHPDEDLAPVLVGHVTLPSGSSGAFGYLWKLRLGADVYYEWKGQRYHYLVDDKRRLPPDFVDAIYVPDGKRLLLLTCDGWDFVNWAYTDRLLVSAMLEAVEPLP